MNKFAVKNSISSLVKAEINDLFQNYELPDDLLEYVCLDLSQLDHRQQLSYLVKTKKKYESYRKVWSNTKDLCDHRTLWDATCSVNDRSCASSESIKTCCNQLVWAVAVYERIPS